MHRGGAFETQLWRSGATPVQLRGSRNGAHHCCHAVSTKSHCIQRYLGTTPTRAKQKPPQARKSLAPVCRSSFPRAPSEKVSSVGRSCCCAFRGDQLNIVNSIILASNTSQQFNNQISFYAALFWNDQRYNFPQYTALLVERSVILLPTMHCALSGAISDTISNTIRSTLPGVICETYHM